ncbi:MAG: ATP-dependent Clp protease adaptor ClpS [Chitinophagales bacterium]|nr:ATP-dependent Clp protease adaptor ClpS [Chitinophagales bacterium]
MSDVLTDEKIEIREWIENLTGSRLIVHNDSVNTFEWVIESLVEICKHTLEQAEQCAFIIHFKGKYAVKDGDKDILSPMRQALIDRGINATLE